MDEQFRAIVGQARLDPYSLVPKVLGIADTGTDRVARSAGRAVRGRNMIEVPAVLIEVAPTGEVQG